MVCLQSTLNTYNITYGWTSYFIGVILNNIPYAFPTIKFTSVKEPFFKKIKNKFIFLFKNIIKLL